MSKIFSRFNLQFTYIKNTYSYLFFLITKILTDFRKAVETGMDPRLQGGVEILPVASCYKNRDKLRHGGPLWLECRLYLFPLPNPEHPERKMINYHGMFNSLNSIRFM